MTTRPFSLRHVAVLLGSFSLVAGLAACGGDDDEPVATAPVVTAPSATDPPAMDPPVTEPPVTDPPVTEPPVAEPEPAPEPEGDPELIWSETYENRPDGGLAMHPDGTEVFLGAGAVFVVQLADGELLDVMVHTAAPRSIDVSPDGAVVAAGLGRQGAAVSDPSGEPVPGLEGLRTVPGMTAGLLGTAGQYDTYVSFSPDGTELVTGDRSGAVQRWNTADGTPIGEFTGSNDAVVAIEHDPTGEVVAVTYFGCEVEVWERATGSLRHQLELESGDGSCALATTLVTFTPDGSSMIVATRDDTRTSVVQVLATADASMIAEFEVLERVRAVDVSPDGEMLVVASRLGTTIRDLPDGALRAEFDETFDATATEQPLAARFTPDGGHIVLTRGDGSVELWRLPGAEELVAPEREPCDPIPVPGDVLFETGSAELVSAADAVLAELADQLAERFPVATLTFVGHTDSRGSAEANQQLSEARAAAVQAWFTAWAEANGIDGWNTSIVGRGDTELKVIDVDADGNFLPEAGALNRRVDITIEAEGCPT